MRSQKRAAFRVSFLHSVEGIEVTGTFRIEPDGSIRPLETFYPSFGAGLEAISPWEDHSITEGTMILRVEAEAMEEILFRSHPLPSTGSPWVACPFPWDLRREPRHWPACVPGGSPGTNSSWTGQVRANRQDQGIGVSRGPPSPKTMPWGSDRMRTLVLVLVALLSCGCLGGPTPRVTLASCGMEGYEGFERQVLDILAQSGIPWEVYLAGGLQQAAGMVARGQAQLALLPADVAWDLYRSEPSFRRLRGIAIAGFLDLHILQATAGALRPLQALDGLRVGLEAGDGRRYLAGVLGASGIRLDGLQCLDKTPSQSIKGLQEGTLDAAMFFLPQGAPGVGLLLEDEGFAWVELEHTAIQRLKEANPFLTKASVPAETYRLPTDGRTLRLPLIIVGHRDLNEEVVSLLAEAFLEETGALLPIPLHDTAGRAARQEGLIQ